MSYSPRNWQSGDIITAAKLNHIENGISSIPDTKIVNIEVSTYDMQNFTVISVDQEFSTIFEGITENDEIWYGRVTASMGQNFQIVTLPLMAISFNGERILGRYLYLDFMNIGQFTLQMDENETSFNFDLLYSNPDSGNDDNIDPDSGNDDNIDPDSGDDDNIDPDSGNENEPNPDDDEPGETLV